MERLLPIQGEHQKAVIKHCHMPGRAGIAGKKILHPQNAGITDLTRRDPASGNPA